MGSPESGCIFPNQIYCVGQEVEVSSDEPGFKGSWYVATVIEPHIPKKLQRARVQYRHLLTEDGNDLLKEYVDEAYIRPMPPQDEAAAEFLEPGEIVDTYFSDGWWTGMVVKVLEDSRYRVFFKNPPDVIDFKRDELRVHQDWFNGKWVRPEKRARNQMAGLIFCSGMDVEARVKEEELLDAWFPAIIIKENKDNTCLLKYQSSRNGDGTELVKAIVDFHHIRPSPPPLHRDRTYSVLEKVDAFCEIAWRAGMIARCIDDTNYVVYFKLTNEDRVCSLSALRPRVEWKDGKWVENRVRGSQEVLPASDFQEQMSQACNNISIPEVIDQVESSVVAKDEMDESTPLSENSRKNLMEQSNPDDGKVVTHALTPRMVKIKLLSPRGDATELHPSKKLKTTNTVEAPSPITACKLRKRGSKISTKVPSRSAATRNGGKQRRRSGVHGNQPFTKTDSRVCRMKVLTKKQKFGELGSQETSSVKKRGRRSKLLVESTPSSAAVKEVNAGGGVGKEIVLEGIRKEAEMPISGVEAMVLPAEDRSMESDQQKSEVKSSKRKRGRPRKFVGKEQNGVESSEIVVEEHPTQAAASDMLTGRKSADSHDVSRTQLAEVSGTNSTANDVGMTSIAASGNMSCEDQPLATWIVGKSSKESKLSLGTIIDECNEARKQHDITQVPAKDATFDSVLDENRRLPFVKTSLLWKSIESMEIFKLMPQDPHFRPLSKCNEVYREGFAIGNMVAFSCLVDKISKLQFDDPRNTFVSYLESVLDLEKLGFDVTVLLGRIKEMLSIRDSGGPTLNESKEAEGKILQYSIEKAEMAEEMVNVEKQLAELQKKHALIKSEMESKKLEISSLQMRVDAINQDFQSARLRFEKLAAAPWKSG